MLVLLFGFYRLADQRFEIIRKIKNGCFDQIFQALRIKRISLRIQKVDNIGFLFSAAPAAFVKLFGGFDGDFNPRFDFLQLLFADLLFDPRDNERGNQRRDQRDNGFNSVPLLPRSVIASASRSVVFSISPNASITSQ